MNRKKILRNKLIRNSKIKVNNVKSIRFRKIHVTYIEDYDIFVCSLIVSLNGQLLSIIGDINPDKYLDGIHIKSPRNSMSIISNCHELYLSKKDAPILHKLIIDFVNETGDRFDDNTYVSNLHGSLDLIDTDKFIDDKDLDKVIQRFSYYD